MEHVVADHSQLNGLFKTFVTSGLAFGAPRWLASIVRHIEWSETLMATKLIADPRGTFFFLFQASLICRLHRRYWVYLYVVQPSLFHEMWNFQLVCSPLRLSSSNHLVCSPSSEPFLIHIHLHRCCICISTIHHLTTIVRKTFDARSRSNPLSIHRF